MVQRKMTAGAVAGLLLAAGAVGAWGAGACGTANAPAVTPTAPATPGVDPAPEGPTHLVMAGLARDAWVRIALAGLVRDRVDPVRLRLWVGGDSTSVYMGSALAEITRELHGTLAGEAHRTSSGLSRPDFFDWPAFLKSEMARTNPNVVVVMFGANDPQGLVTPDGQVVQPLSDGWRAEYERRVSSTMDLLAAPDRLQVWVGQPVMAPQGFNEQMKVIDQIYRDEAARHPGAIYVDSYALFATPTGGYRDGGAGPDGAYITWRADDGIHFTVAGGAYLADAVIAAIRANIELETD